MHPVKLAVTVGAVAASLAPVAAQVVSPAHFENAEALRSYNGPFGQPSTSGWRYLQVHDDLAGTPRVLRGLAVRRNGGEAAPYPSFSARFTVILSTAATTGATVDAMFANNHGTNMQTVLNDRVVEFRTTTASGAPADFEYVVTFDQPYMYDGNGPLCWEVKTSSYQNLTIGLQLDSVQGASTNPPLQAGPFGFGCRHSTQTSAMGASGSSSMQWASGVGTLTLSGSRVPSGAPVAALFGISKERLGPLRLPYLLPGTLTSSSGPCALFVSNEFSFTPQVSGTNATLQLPIPAQMAYHGSGIYAQFVAVDPRVGDLNVVSSNAVEFNWVAPFANPEVGQVYATNLFATSGTARAQYGYVVQFR